MRFPGPSITLAYVIVFSEMGALTPQALGDGGMPLWTNRFNGPADDVGYAGAVAVDNRGNIIVSGYSTNTLGGNNPSYDYVTVKYSSAGVPIWTNRYEGPGGNSVANAVAVDGSGHVCVTGFALYISSGYDYGTVSYSSAGEPLWTNTYNGPVDFDDYAVAVAADIGDNLFVTGYSAGSGAFPYNKDYATVKYSSAGVALWTNRYNGIGDGDDYPLGLAVDNTGNVVVTGYSDSTGFGTNFDFATIKYSSAGLPVWTNRYHGPAFGRDEPRGIAVDSSNNVVVAGISVDTNGLPYFVTLKYSSEGLPLWTNRHTGPENGFNIAKAVAIDASGCILVTGVSLGISHDWVTIKYSSAGSALWTNRYSGEASAMAVDTGGNVFVTGDSYNGATGSDYATVAYSRAGIPLWTNRYDGAANGDDFAERIAVDNDGGVIVMGYSWNGGFTSSGRSYDYVTIKYSSVIRPYLEAKRLNDQLVLSWTNSAFALETAPLVTATFTNIPAATSPYTNSIASPQQFFRLKGF